MFKGNERVEGKKVFLGSSLNRKVTTPPSSKLQIGMTKKVSYFWRITRLCTYLFPYVLRIIEVACIVKTYSRANYENWGGVKNVNIEAQSLTEQYTLCT